MQSGFWGIATQLRLLLRRQGGQDLVEYALVVALIALSAFVGIKAAALGILNLFINIISVIDINLV
jgi:pilus assembly protein Flp/PilA